MDRAGPATAADVEGWYRDHRVELVRLATLAVGDRDRAEDVVHDVFAGLQRRPPALHDPARPAPYLRAAVLNRCRSRLLRRATRRATDDALSRQPEVAAGASTEDQGVGSATRAEVLAAVQRLPRRQRDVVLLRYWLDLSEAEIAETLGVAPGTVKTSAHRGLKALTPLLEELR